MSPQLPFLRHDIPCSSPFPIFPFSSIYTNPRYNSHSLLQTHQPVSTVRFLPQTISHHSAVVFLSLSTGWPTTFVDRHLISVRSMVILDRCLSQSVGRDTSTMISSAYPEFYQSPMRVEGMYSPYSPRPQCGDLTSCLPPFYHPAGPVAGPVVQDPAYPVSCDHISTPRWLCIRITWLIHMDPGPPRTH